MPEVRFELPGAEYAEYTWVLFDEHAPSAQTPLLNDGPFGTMGPPRPAGPELPRMIRVNGYTYMRNDVDLTTSPFAARSSVLTRDELRQWRTEWLPQVADVVALLRGFDAASVQPGEWQATLDQHADAFRRVFIAIHRFAVGHAEATARGFLRAYVDAGLGSEEQGRELLQGFANASLDRAALVWDMSRALRGDTALAIAVAQGAPLPESETARTLAQQLEAVLNAYGDTTNSNNQDLPTWREDPSLVYAQALASARQPDNQDPRALAAQQRRRREELEPALRSRNPELLPLLDAAQEYLPNLEDHNYHVDQRMLAASRARYLAIGAWLASQGLVERADDVFYVYQDEMVPALEEGVVPPQSELARRREFVAACRQVPPPPLLGKDATRGSVTIVKGIGASQGSYKGRARLIAAVEDAGLLQPGEVLVCRATTPAWTPLFGVAGAVVTNAGGALSHTAIVAREFGIPAVLGTQNGTQLIPDGAIVTVDGTAGLVTIEDEA